MGNWGSDTQLKDLNNKRNIIWSVLIRYEQMHSDARKDAPRYTTIRMPKAISSRRRLAGGFGFGGYFPVIPTKDVKKHL